MANLTPLAAALARGAAGYRRGQLLREQLDADEADRAARRARETRQLDLQSQALRDRLAEREAERDAERAEFTARVQALVDAGVPPERAKAGALFPGLADNFLPQPAPRPLLRDQMRQRIEDLMQQGRTLDQANSQARREFGYTVPVAGAAAGGRAAASPITDARRNLPIYERGVREAQSAVTAAQRAMPERPAFGFLTPSDSTRFMADSTAAQADVEVAREALREARAARDSVAAEVTGAPPAAGVDDAATPDRMQTEMRNAFQRRQRLLDRGVDREEVDRAYQATVQLILRRYGQG
jgi:hypothetical protein